MDVDNALQLSEQDSVYLPTENIIFPVQMLVNSPSRAEGCSLKDEIRLRIAVCDLIQHAGRLLDLPQPAIATAQILIQRYYLKKSILVHNVEIFAMAAVLLSGKCEEEIRRIRDLVNVFNFIEKKQEHSDRAVKPLDYYGMDYVRLKSYTVDAERRLLKELGFCVHVQHSHKWIVSIVKIIGCEDNSQLLQKAWNYMNDSLKSPVFLFHLTESIACGCIHLAALKLDVKLPDSPAWWTIFGLSEIEINDICRQILYLYTLPKLNMKVERDNILKKLDVAPKLKYDVNFNVSKDHHSSHTSKH